MPKDKRCRSSRKGPYTGSKEGEKTATSQSLVDEVRRSAETPERVLLASDDDMAGKNPFEVLLGCERASSRIMHNPLK